MAQETKEFNIKDKVFCECFPDLTEEINECLKKQREAEAEKAKLNALGNSPGGVSGSTSSTNADPVSGLNEVRQSNMQIQNWTSSLLSNFFVVIGLAAFAFVVKSVFNE